MFQQLHKLFKQYISSQKKSLLTASPNTPSPSIPPNAMTSTPSKRVADSSNDEQIKKKVREMEAFQDVDD